MPALKFRNAGMWIIQLTGWFVESGDFMITILTILSTARERSRKPRAGLTRDTAR
jgi:hypothetical protein